MCPSSAADGPASLPSARRRYRGWIVVGVILAIVLGAAIVAAFAPRPGSSSSRGTLGPYTLSTFNTTSLPLGFPRCSIVTAVWNVSGVGNETFTIWEPAVPSNTTCPAPGPTPTVNCPHRGCPSYLGRSPVCVEWGYSGSCEFQSTQTNYTFLLYSPYDQSPFAALSFTASYT